MPKVSARSRTKPAAIAPLDQAEPGKELDDIAEELWEDLGILKAACIGTGASFGEDRNQLARGAGLLRAITAAEERAGLIVKGLAPRRREA